MALAALWAATLGLPASSGAGSGSPHLPGGLPPPCVGHQTLENSSLSIVITANEELCSYLVHVPRSLAPSGLTLWFSSDEACSDETELHIRTYDGPTSMAALVAGTDYSHSRWGRLLKLWRRVALARVCRYPNVKLPEVLQCADSAGCGHRLGQPRVTFPPRLPD